MRRLSSSRRSTRTVFARLRPLACFAALSVTLSAANCDAQLTQNQRETLAARIDAVREDLDPDRVPQLSAAAERLQQAYENLVAHLEATADDETQQGWLDYLRYDPLAEAIEEDAAVARQGRLARQLYWRLVRNQPGLEREPLVAFRRAVDQFISAALFRDAERTVQTVNSQLGQVAELLRESDGGLTAQETAQINRVLQYLEASRLAPELVTALRSSLGQPNARIMIGEDLITELINRPVDRTTPSNECILGIRVIGQAQLNGMVLANLLPSEGAARLQLTLTAQFSNLGTAYASPVRIRTHGFGNVTASRVLQIADAGVAPEPVYANAALDSRVLGIEHHLRIVRKIAARRAAEQKQAANREAAAKLELRVAREFAEETNQQLADGNMIPRGEVEEVLRRLGLTSPERQWGSSSDYLRVGLVVRDRDQTTTAVPPPHPASGHDLVVQLEESLVDNVASQILAERTLTEAELRSFVTGIFPALKPAAPEPVVEAAEVAREAAEALGIVEPVKISFAALRPVIFEARDGSLRLGLRGTRFEQDGQVLEQALEITARYLPKRAQDGTVLLEREGDVDVGFPGGANRRLSITQIALRQAVVQKLAQAFPQQLLAQPIELPENESTGANGSTGVGAGANLQDVRLHAQQITLQDGWMSVGFNAAGGGIQDGRMLVLD